MEASYILCCCLLNNFTPVSFYPTNYEALCLTFSSGTWKAFRYISSHLPSLVLKAKESLAGKSININRNSKIVSSLWGVAFICQIPFLAVYDKDKGLTSPYVDNGSGCHSLYLRIRRSLLSIFKVLGMAFSTFYCHPCNRWCYI